MQYGLYNRQNSLSLYDIKVNKNRTVLKHVFIVPLILAWGNHDVTFVWGGLSVFTAMRDLAGISASGHYFSSWFFENVVRAGAC